MVDPKRCVKFEVRLQAGSRTFAADLDLPEDIAHPTDLAVALRQLANALTAFQLDGLPEPVSCRAGCSVCCNQLVPVNEPEMHALVQLVQQLEPAHRDRVQARFDDIISRLDRAGLTEQLRSPPRDPVAYQKLMLDYFALGAECPFLEEERCSIYADRPSLCRQYNVTSPAHLCSDPFNNDITMVPMPAFVDHLCMNAFADLHNITVKVTPLPLAPEWVERNPDHLPSVPAIPLLQHMVTQLQHAFEHFYAKANNQ
jgi:Fe-S-cluster containining protein